MESMIWRKAFKTDFYIRDNTPNIAKDVTGIHRSNFPANVSSFLRKITTKLETGCWVSG